MNFSQEGENLDVYYISQSFFSLPRQSIRDKSDRILLFKQTLGDVECMYKDIGVYDKKNIELKKMCRKAWIENFNYLCFDMARNKKEGKNRICKENNNTYFGRIPESEPF